MARPLVKIDAKLVETMASWGAKTVEIANYFGASEDTITRRFAAELRKGRTNVRMSLRQWQLSAAKKGNATMLIWLGKQMLGQVDQVDINHSVEARPLKELTDEELEKAADASRD